MPWKLAAGIVAVLHVTMPLQCAVLVFAIHQGWLTEEKFLVYTYLFLAGTFLGLFLNDCPCTVLEKWLLRRGGIERPYDGTFINKVVYYIFGNRVSEKLANLLGSVCLGVQVSLLLVAFIIL